MVLAPFNQPAIDDPNLLEEQVAGIPWKRAAQPEEIAKLAHLLASSDADYVTGSTYVMDGGLMRNLGQGASSDLMAGLVDERAMSWMLGSTDPVWSSPRRSPHVRRSDSLVSRAVRNARRHWRGVRCWGHMTPAPVTAKDQNSPSPFHA